MRRILLIVGVLFFALGAGWRMLDEPPSPPASAAPDTEPAFGGLLVSSAASMPWSSDPIFRKATEAGSMRKWPVTSTEVHVGCVLEAGPMTTIVVVEGRPYALNGLTQAWARQRGYTLEINGAPVPVLSESHPRWWKADDEIPGARVDIKPLFDAAHAMGCLPR